MSDLTPTSDRLMCNLLVKSLLTKFTKCNTNGSGGRGLYPKLSYPRQTDTSTVAQMTQKSSFNSLNMMAMIATPPMSHQAFSCREHPSQLSRHLLEWFQQQSNRQLMRLFVPSFSEKWALFRKVSSHVIVSVINQFPEWVLSSITM